jgi:hypothetical protein
LPPDPPVLPPEPPVPESLPIFLLPAPSSSSPPHAENNPIPARKSDDTNKNRTGFMTNTSLRAYLSTPLWLRGIVPEHVRVLSRNTLSDTLRDPRRGKR